MISILLYISYYQPIIMRVICNTSEYIEFNHKNAISLEIKFNLTDKGKIWKEIGDALYYNTDIVVDSIKFNFIKNKNFTN